MVHISEFFKEERDPLYIRGAEKTLSEKNRAFTKALLAENKFTIEDIARLVNVPVEFVEQIKKEIES